MKTFNLETQGENVYVTVETVDQKGNKVVTYKKVKNEEEGLTFLNQLRG